MRRTLDTLLGPLPPRPRRVSVRLLGRRAHAAYVREDLQLADGTGQSIPAALVLPRSAAPPWPGILWHHGHGGNWEVGLEELFLPHPTPRTPATELAERGFAVLAIDARPFGARRGTGPDGPNETGREEELSLAKLRLWQGTSLWATMVREDRIALDYLSARPDIDARRIGATGMSMGSTRSWWLAALDDRIAAVAGVACLTRYQDLVRARALNRHSFYYFVPGVLRHFDVEAIISLIAPRPFLAVTGTCDPGSPVPGVRRIAAAARPVWALHGRAADFRSILHTGVGHTYTPAMWEQVLAWLSRHLAREGRPGEATPPGGARTRTGRASPSGSPR